MRRIDELIKYKKWLFHEYTTHLGKITELNLNQVNSDVDSVYWIVAVKYDDTIKLTKEEICKKFLDDNISIRPFYYPITSMPPYKQYVDKNNFNKISYEISERSICLPNGYNLDEKKVKYICDTLKRILGY